MSDRSKDLKKNLDRIEQLKHKIESLKNDAKVLEVELAYLQAGDSELNFGPKEEKKSKALKIDSCCSCVSLVEGDDGGALCNPEFVWQTLKIVHEDYDLYIKTKLTCIPHHCWRAQKKNGFKGAIINREEE